MYDELSLLFIGYLFYRRCHLQQLRSNERIFRTLQKKKMIIVTSVESYFIFASKISKEMFELHRIFSTLMFSNVLFIRRRQVRLLYSIIALRVHFPSIWSAYAVNAAQCILSSRCPPRQNVSNVNSCDTYKCTCISSTWKRQLICNVDRPWRRAGG